MSSIQIFERNVGTRHEAEAAALVIIRAAWHLGSPKTSARRDAVARLEQAKLDIFEELGITPPNGEKGY